MARCVVFCMFGAMGHFGLAMAFLYYGSLNSFENLLLQVWIALTGATMTTI